MTKKERKPNIRFQGFADEWEERKLYEVVELNPKSVLPDEFEYVDLESIEGTEMVSHRTETRETAPSRAQRLAQTGDVFFQTVRPYQRNNYLFAKPDNNYVFSTGYAQMRPKIDAEFLMCFLQTDSFVKVVLNNCTGTSYPAINSNDLSNLEIVLPASEDEQRRIGSFITNLDNLIILNQRKYDKLINVRKSMLEKMIQCEGKDAPEIRFAGFTDPWEQRKLSDITSLITKGTTPLDKSGNGDINFIKVENLDNSNGEIISSSKITREEHEGYLKRSQLKKDDILFSIAGTLGRVGVVKSSILPANTNQALSIIRLKEGCLSYIATVLKGNAVEEFIRRNPTIGAQPNLSLEQVSNPIVPYPTLDEQEKIGGFFEMLDKTITLQQRKLEKLQNFKKSMLEKMFV